MAKVELNEDCKLKWSDIKITLEGQKVEVIEGRIDITMDDIIATSKIINTMPLPQMEYIREPIIIDGIPCVITTIEDK